ncbi:hypothetical protein CFP56_021182 [Quercus suber]|uniref:Uncharacterized protein n=1 Tax=Quercus suber TaxID=58331 RepID=A0AAW0KDH8_QUESU
MVVKELREKRKDLNLRENIIRFNRLCWLLIRDSKFLKNIPKLPKETILVAFANTFTRFAKLQFLKILNCMQFRTKLGLPQDLKCSRVKGNQQIDFSSWVFLSKFDCDHLWFYGEPRSQLQKIFGDLMQVGISSKISHRTSKFGKFAPMIARMGVHVECICSPQNSVIIQDNVQNVDDFEDTMLTPLLPPFSTSNGSHTNLGCLSRLRC